MDDYFWQDMALPAPQQPLIQQAWLRVLVFFIVYIGAASLSLLLGASLLAFGSRQLGPEAFMKFTAGNGFIIGLLVVHAFFANLVVVLFRKLIDRKSLLSLGFYWKPIEAAIGFVLGPALLGTGSMILYFSGNLHWTDLTFSGIDLLLSFLLMLIIAVSEEAVFRGYILNNLLTAFPNWLAVLITSLLFVLVHIGNQSINGIALINLFLMAVLLSLNYIHTRNLWFSIAFHFSWNFFQGPILGYEVSGLPIPSLLQQELTGAAVVTGDHFGFEGSLINTFLSIIVMLLLALAFERKYKTGAGLRADQ